MGSVPQKSYTLNKYQLSASLLTGYKSPHTGERHKAKLAATDALGSEGKGQQRLRR